MNRQFLIALIVALGTVAVAKTAEAGATVQLSPTVKKQSTPQTPRSVLMTGRLKYGDNEREVIAGVSVAATTTDGRTLTVNGDPRQPGDVAFNNPNPSVSASTYQGIVYDTQLKNYRISVTFKRYYRINGNWFYDRQYTVQSPTYSW